MKNSLFILLVAAIFVVAGGVLPSYVEACAGCGCRAKHEHSKDEEKGSKVEVGNKICPIEGGKIAKEGGVKVEHEGKIYNLCCSGCIEEFKKNPEKYIKIAEELKEKESE